MTRFSGFALIAFLLTANWTPTARAETSTGTLTLDGLSFVSFEDEEVLRIPSGSTLRFHFGERASDGSIPFTLGPEDVEIAPIPMPTGGGTLQYRLVSTASGTIRPTESGRRMEFTASIAASLERPEGSGTFTYIVPFTTEAAEAPNSARTDSVETAGMRLVEGARYVQLVGATTNRTNAFPKPGAAVYTVLSGSFDRLP
jgi:hypothetical protein